MVRVGGLCVTHVFHKVPEGLGSRALEDIIEFLIINIRFSVIRSTNTRPKKQEFPKHHPLFTISNSLLFFFWKQSKTPPKTWHAFGKIVVIVEANKGKGK